MSSQSAETLTHAAATLPGMHDLYSFLNVAIVVAVVVLFFGKGIKELFAGRSQKIKLDIVQAREELKKITQDIEIARKQIENIEAEKATLIARVESEAKILAAKLIEEAKQAAARIKDDTGRAVSAEFADMSEKLKEELLVSLMLKVKTELSNENNKQKIHDKLVESFLNDVPNIKNEFHGGVNGSV